MRKAIARGLIVVSAVTGLFMGSGGSPAVAHHQGGHHCHWPNSGFDFHRHPKSFYQELKAQRRAARQAGDDATADAITQEIKKHRHHSHRCRGRVYPPR